MRRMGPSRSRIRTIKQRMPPYHSQQTSPPAYMFRKYTLQSGGAQSGTVGTTLNPFVVLVEDVFSDLSEVPVPNVSASWNVGDVYTGGSFTATETTTDANGLVRATFQMGNIAQTGSVILAADNAQPFQIFFTATAAPPAGQYSIVLMQGNNQVGYVSEQLPIQVVVEVRDTSNNLAVGDGLTWTPSGNGSVQSASTVTDGSGRGSAYWTLGSTAGSQSLVVTEAAEGRQVTVTATAVAQPPTGIGGQFNHAKFAVMDYQTNYTPEPYRTQQRTFNGEHCDMTISGGGNATWYENYRSSIVTAIYHLGWSLRGVDTGSGTSQELKACEDWLVANGYDKESAFLHQAGFSDAAHRITFPMGQWGNRNVVNPSNAGVIAYWQHLVNTTVNNGKDTVFWDEWGDGQVKLSSLNTSEEYSSYASFYADWVPLLISLKALTPVGYTIINVGEYVTAADALLSDAAGAVMQEFVNQPWNASILTKLWNFTDARVAAGTREIMTSYRDTEIVDLPWPNVVNQGQTMYAAYAATAEFPNRTANAVRIRTQEYCNYLMCVDSTASLVHCHFGVTGSGNPAEVTKYPHMGYNWFKWCAVDIGKPTTSRSLYLNTTDPVGQKCLVYIRYFQNGFVLNRIWPTQMGYQCGDNSAVTVTLPAGTWKQLWPDGTLNPTTQTTVDLRHVESAIFMAA